MKEKYDIIGMSCSGCSSYIEKNLNSMDYVLNAKVNLLSNSMIIEYDEKNLTSAKIIETINNLGYGACLQDVTKAANNIDTISDKNKKEKTILLFSLLFTILLMYISMGELLYLPFPTIISMHENTLINSVAQLLLTLPIIFINKNYFIRGFKYLAKLSPNMDSLIAIASSSAFLFGIVAIYMINLGYINNNPILINSYSHNLYFESSAMILTFIRLGKYLEAGAKKKTVEAISNLIKLTPKTVHKLDNNDEIEIAINDLSINDIIKIYPGEIIPVDAIVISGISSIDESALTGESMPKTVQNSDYVMAGSVNHSGTLILKAKHIGEDTTLNKIIQLVQNASESKAKISKLADKIARIFVPTIILISICTFTIWMLITSNFNKSISNAITVLVISCPCALGLATPVSIMVATGRAYRNGILIRNAETLEIASKIDSIIFDKTATLTIGKPSVVDVITNINYEEFRNIAYSLEKLSNHPFANAITSHFFTENAKDLHFSNLQIIQGKGVICFNNTDKFFAGNLSLIESYIVSDIIKQIMPLDKIYSDEQKTPIYFFKNSTFLGTITLRDELKPQAIALIENLQQRNKNILILSGDHLNPTSSIAEKLHISNFYSNALPEDKYRIVDNLQKSGHIVAMVGDGINDSPSLAKADVSISVSNGSDLAIETSNIIVNSNNILDISTVLDLSKATLKNIKQNLFWAFSYNLVCIPLASGLFANYGLVLNPMIASCSMSISSLLVVLNALRLKNIKL